MEPSTPFLLQTADAPAHDQEDPDAADDAAPDVHPEIFHTRCGHPRHIDD
ncbi:hypothetical protein KGM48_02545 [Patescibacteria group bacterium]|nr:hypothetical protein [Patescibacteria group bacterium]